jgi:hypothetical protein
MVLDATTRSTAKCVELGATTRVHGEFDERRIGHCIRLGGTRVQ